MKENDYRVFISTTSFEDPQESGYPSNTVAINLSKETTKRELISIDGIGKKTFKMNNINLVFGKVNHISYCTEMMNFPTMVELKKKIKSKILGV